MYLEFTGLKFRSKTDCICGIPECRDVVKQFRKIKDIRGCLQYIPNPLSSKETDYAKNCRHYNNRIAKHFPAARERVKSIRNEVPEKETRSSRPIRKYAEIALWHFDKRILRSESCFCVGKTGDVKVHWFIPKDIARDLGVYNYAAGSDILYTNADRCKYKYKGNEVIALVPTMYKMKVIKQDLDDACKEKEVKELLKERIISEPEQPF
jgi:hypothetical protein